MGKKAMHNDPGMLLPSFEIHTGDIEIISAPYRPSDHRVVDSILDAVEEEEYDLAYVKLPRLLDKYPLDFDLINAYMLALNEIDGGMAALTFFEGKLQRFNTYLAEKTVKVISTKNPKQLVLPGVFLGNKPFLRSLYNSGLFLVFEGRGAEAIDRFLQLLGHDPTTTYEARTFIVHLAIENGKIDDVSKMAQIRIPTSAPDMPVPDNSGDPVAGVGDRGIGMNFGWGLYFFLTGDRAAARRWFESGIRRNPNVVKFMFQGMQPEDEDSVNYSFATGTYTPGEESEAMAYIDAWFDLWRQNPDALGFLRAISLDLGAHEERLFHLRITMRHVLPLVSRLVAINSTSTFQDLARVICESLGWSGIRKHEFVVTARTAPSPNLHLADSIKEILAEESFTIGMYEPEADEGIGYDDDLDADVDEASIEDAVDDMIEAARKKEVIESGISDVPGDDVANDDADDEADGEADGDEDEEITSELGDAVLEPDYYEDEVTLYEMFMKTDARAVFTYDFGAYWEFDIVLDQVLPRDNNARDAVVLASSGLVPSEDAGGPTSHMKVLLEGKTSTFSTKALGDLRVQYEKLLADEVEQSRIRRENVERTIKESIDRRLRKNTSDNENDADEGNDDDGSN